MVGIFTCEDLDLAGWGDESAGDEASADFGERLVALAEEFGGGGALPGVGGGLGREDHYYCFIG